MGTAAKIATIIWDFDGVIVESNSIREKGFIEVLSDFNSEDVNLLLEFHRKNGGLSRYVKFRYFFEEILKISIEDQAIKGYAERFSEIMKQFMTNKDILIKETVTFIQRNHRLYKFHIASGSDQRELRYLCGQLGIAQYFYSIHGSPQPKKDIVKELLSANSYDPSTTLLIGDAINDYEASKANGIAFMGYNCHAMLLGLSDISLDFKS
jgi:HAD superfamily hydrolase (TIGR01549 family)